MTTISQQTDLLKLVSDTGTSLKTLLGKVARNRDEVDTARASLAEDVKRVAVEIADPSCTQSQMCLQLHRKELELNSAAANEALLYSKQLPAIESKFKKLRVQPVQLSLWFQSQHDRNQVDLSRVQQYSDKFIAPLLATGENSTGENSQTAGSERPKMS